jgi:hypothetical protein
MTGTMTVKTVVRSFKTRLLLWIRPLKKRELSETKITLGLQIHAGVESSLLDS